MKLHIMLSCLTLFISAATHADFDGAVIDLVKFRKAAGAAFKEVDQTLSGTVNEVMFQDAAFATDSGAPFDGAMVYAFGPKINLVGSEKEFVLAYRLVLGTGKAEAIFVSFTESSREIALPDSLIVAFPREESKEQVTQVFEKVRQELGETDCQFELLANLKRFVIDLKVPSAKGYLQATKTVQNLVGSKVRIVPNFEKYRTEFAFGKMQNISAEKLVDLDGLRDIIPNLLANGKILATSESKIPAELVAR